jgi:hypothetical protein
MYLIKTSFILSLVVFLMPSPPEQGQAVGTQAQFQVPTQVDLVSAASNTVADVSSFCERQAAVCKTANYLAWKLEAKARYGIRLIYEWANEGPVTTNLPQGYANQAVLVDPLTTGSSRQIASTGNRPAPSQNTLMLEDLIPAWRGPRSTQVS